MSAFLAGLADCIPPFWGVSMRALLAVLGLVLLSACSTPSSGPSASGVEQSARYGVNGSTPVIELTNAVVPVISDGDSQGLSSLGGGRFNSSVMRPGDQIEVRIFDKTEEGLLSAADSKAVDLGRFRVDQSGYVSLPYVGRLKAGGASTASLQNRIVEKLKGSSMSPQAVVSVVEQGGSGFTVNGAVHGAQRFNLSGQSERVLDGIAMAGGPTAAPGETEVTLIRGSRRSTVGMDRLIAEPSQNVYLQPNDQIYVRRDTPSYTSFGAFKSPGEFNFETGELTMAQAIARSGGLLDDRANAKKVYLFRREPADVARRVGMIPPNDPRSGMVPVVYTVDLTKTPAYFMMQSLKMKKGDMLYAPNAGTADFGKAFQIFEKSPPTAAAPLPGRS